MALHERVRAGMAFLDEQDPDWVWKVWPEDLWMDSGHQCVVGQLRGSFRRAAAEWWPECETPESRFAAAAELGFAVDESAAGLDTPPGDPAAMLAEYDLLTRLWRFAIRRRRELVG